MATARAPRRSLRKPSPPCPFFDSTTTDLASGLEAESADLLSGSLNFYYWKTGIPPPQSGESRPLLVHLGPAQLPQFAEPLCRNPYQNPQMRSSPYPLSFHLCAPLRPTSNGEICGPPSRNPILGKAEITPGKSPVIPGGAV